MVELLSSFFGYLASLLLAISLLVNNAISFRIINILGCFSFITYGILINTKPIILTNSILAIINIFQLVKLYKSKERFSFIEIDHGNEIVNQFLNFYKKDINDYFPDFTFDYKDKKISFVVLRDIAISNIFVANLSDDGTAYVEINYTIPKYRDYKVGKFIFDVGKGYLISKGINRILYKKVDNKEHEHFIQKMGFKKTLIEGKEFYCQSLA